MKINEKEAGDGPFKKNSSANVQFFPYAFDLQSPASPDVRRF